MEEDEEAAEGMKPADMKVRARMQRAQTLAQCDVIRLILLQVILLGDSAVGKSKLVERFLMDDYHPRQVRVTAAVFVFSLASFSIIDFQ